MLKRTISCQVIVVAANRQRKEFDEGKHQEMIASLQKPHIGLLHPPVLRIDRDHYALVAGERRLRAIKEIYELGGSVYFEGEPLTKGFIPYVLLNELTEIEAMEAELEENVRRVDLSWAEKARATEALAALRNAQAALAGVPPPTTADLSEEIRGRRDGFQQAETREELIVAKHLDDPDVKGAGTLKEAVKILKKKEEVRRNEQLAKTIGLSFTSASHSIINRDSSQFLPTLPPGKFDVILTDAPYGMGADTFGDSGGRAGGAHGYADSEENLFEIMNWFPAESFRLAKPEAHLYLFLDFDRFHQWKVLLEEAGWKVFRTPFVWYSPGKFRAPWPDKGPQRNYELALFASKGGRNVTKMQGDVVTYAADDNLGHGAQKPVALYRDLLSRSVRPGDSVLDPFCGTGPIFPAAHSLKCSAHGVEMDEASFAISHTRIKGLI